MGSIMTLYSLNCLPKISKYGKIMNLFEYETMTAKAAQIATYARMMRYKSQLEDERQMLDLKMVENAECLLKLKKRMCSVELCGIADLEKFVRTVSQWLTSIEKKEIKRNTACDGKRYHEILCNWIEDLTEIKIKHITKIELYGLDVKKFSIYFIESKHKKTLRIDIPNIASDAFNKDSANFYSPAQYKDFTDAIGDLDVTLYEVTEDDDWHTSVIYVAAYPTDVTSVSGFGKSYEEHFVKRYGGETDAR